MCLCLWGCGCRDHRGDIQRANLPDYGNLGGRESGDHQAAAARQQQDRHREHAHFTRRYGLKTPPPGQNPSTTNPCPTSPPPPPLLRLHPIFPFSFPAPWKLSKDWRFNNRLQNFRRSVVVMPLSTSRGRQAFRFPKLQVLLVGPTSAPPLSSSFLCCLVCQRPVLMSPDRRSQLVSSRPPKKLS